MSGVPAISVVVPAYNVEPWIGAALDSVLGQTCPPAELLVVDDGSTDGTAAVVARYGERVRYVRQANRGPAAARDHGLELAHGELLAFLDADDLWPPDALAVLRKALVAARAPAVAHGLVRDLWPGDRAGEHRLEPAWRGFNLGSALFHCSVFEQVGGFDPALRQGEDIDLWMRLRQRGVTTILVDEVTLHYRRALSDRIDGRRIYQCSLLRGLKRVLDSSRRR